MDTESTESGLEDVFRELDNQAIQSMVIKIDSFLDSTEDENQKVAFVKKCTDMYYPQMQPLDWLSFVVEQLKFKLNTI